MIDDNKITFAVQELEGVSPILIVLHEGLLPEVGLELPSEVRGKTYMPLGGREGYSTVTGMTWDKSEMTCFWDAAFMNRGEITALNLEPGLTFTPEGLLDAFVTLQKRGRECLVQIAGFSRRGILRRVTPKPGRGYGLDPSSGRAGTPGVNLEVKLAWEWSGEREFFSANAQSITGGDLAGKLTGVNTKLNAALADSDALSPDFLTSLKGGIGRLRAGVTNLRKGLQGIGNLARAPASLANQLLAAGRSLGNLTSDFQSLLSDTSDDYKALGEAAKGIIGTGNVGASVASKMSAKRATASAAAAAQDSADVVAALFDALRARKAQTIGVREGQSLGDIARQHLGSADRWPEIAAANQITGQVVPKGIYQLEIPARGR